MSNSYPVRRRSVLAGVGALTIGLTSSISVRDEEPSIHTVSGENADDIQAAINDADPHDEVVVESGTYVGQVGIPQEKEGLALRGQGEDSVIRAPEGDDPQQQVGIAADDVTVEHIATDGNRDNVDLSAFREEWGRGALAQADGIGIYADGVSIRHCYVTRSQSHGIIVWGRSTPPQMTPVDVSAGNRYDNEIRFNTVEDTGDPLNERAMVDVANESSADTTPRRTEISDNTIIGGDHSGTFITLHGAFRTWIRRNEFAGSITNPQMIAPHTDNHGMEITEHTIRAEDFAEVPDEFVRLGDVPLGLVENNDIEGLPGPQVSVSSQSQPATIRNNRFAGGEALHVEGDRVAVENNDIES